jgi:short-subunit dehydrogenase
MDTPVDLFIYTAAIWEKQTFSELKDAEVIAIIHVNLTSLLIALRDLFPNIAASGNGKVVLIGSTWGLENAGAGLVVYTATKFAMRGAAHALRKLFRPVGVPVTVISPGSIATDVPSDAGREAALERHCGARMPVHDLVSIISTIRLLSPASCVKEVHLPALQDTDV